MVRFIQLKLIFLELLQCFFTCTFGKSFKTRVPFTDWSRVIFHVNETMCRKECQEASSKEKITSESLRCTVSFIGTILSKSTDKSLSCLALAATIESTKEKESSLASMKKRFGSPYSD